MTGIWDEFTFDARHYVRSLMWSAEGEVRYVQRILLPEDWDPKAHLAFDGTWSALTDPSFWIEMQVGRWRLPVAPRLDGS